MSLSKFELDRHCRLILGQRKISNKIVVLCEGIRTQDGERLSPQLYSKMEELPDANFYRACIPSYWRQRKPCFFNCGDRNDTIATYKRLRELNELEATQSYLSTDLLFALVDVDLNTAEIEDYHFPDTETIFHDLYQDLRVKLDRLPEHRIWVTGLKHKEAYFINPALQQVFDEYPNPVIYRDLKLHLENIYHNIATELTKDRDIKSHFAKAVKRISHCHNLDRANPARLSVSWQQQLAASENRSDELVFGLLAISASKPYWAQVQPDENYSRSASDFRGDLSLHIAREFYSKQNGIECSEYHLPCFFNYLYDLVH
jgi:hypothetical protein